MTDFNCIKCSQKYTSTDDEAYLCESCNRSRLQIAKEIDNKFKNKPRKQPVSQFQTMERLGKTINSQSGGLATFIKARDLGIQFDAYNN